MWDARTMQAGQRAVRPALVWFALWIGCLASISVNGYALNLLGQAANPWVIGALTLIELGVLARWLAPTFRLRGDPFELAGFWLITVAVWIYFVLPALPTLIPPTYSGDAINHLVFAEAVYSTGRIIGDYPGGAALILATLAHWTGAPLLRLTHPFASLWIALMAGGIYLLACSMLPARREYKTLALFSVWALFIAWDYFGGLLIQYSYFLTQVGAQMFIVAFACFLGEYLEARHPIWLVGMAACLISISVLFQLWLIVPAAMLIIMLARHGQTPNAPRSACALLVVLGAPLFFWVAILWRAPQFMPDLARFGATGAVLDFSFNALDLLLILAILGILLANGSAYRVQLAGVFLIAAALQCLALLVGQRFGSSDYWFNKSIYLAILPLALFAVVPFARGMEWLQRKVQRNFLATLPGFVSVFGILAGGVGLFFPPPTVSILNETDIQAALWANQNLNTRHVHYISRKDLVAQWLAIGFWHETLPDDLLVDLAILGPKTYEAWRADPAWGAYLFISSRQRMPLDNSVRTIYRNGATRIVQKPAERLAALDPASAVHFDQVLALGNYTLAAQAVRPGDVITLTAPIATDQIPLHQVVWRLQLRDLENNPIAETRLAPFDNKFPLQRWPNDIALTQVFTLTVPVDARPGLTDLQLGLYYVGNGAALTAQTPAGVRDDVAHLGNIKIDLPPVTPHELASITRLDAQVGTAIQLLGYRLEQTFDDALALTLYWQSTARTSNAYTVFAHLVDAAGVLRAQQDAEPRGGTYPTSIWEPGEIIIDPYILAMPRELARAPYQIEVGLYALPEVRRLNIFDADGRLLGDHVVLPVSNPTLRNR